MGLFGSIGGGIGAALGAPFLGSTALALADTGLGMIGANQQNKWAEGMAHGAQDFSASEAQKQMEFQERMSSTAHQREVEDLKKAGLNPILSANAGASSPGGAMGSGVNAPVVSGIGPTFLKGLSSALDVKRLSKELDQAAASINLDNESANTQRSMQAKLAADAELSRATARSVEAGLPQKENRANVEKAHPKIFGWADALTDRLPLSGGMGAALGYFLRGRKDDVDYGPGIKRADASDRWYGGDLLIKRGNK